MDHLNSQAIVTSALDLIDKSLMDLKKSDLKIETKFNLDLKN